MFQRIQLAHAPTEDTPISFSLLGILLERGAVLRGHIGDTRKDPGELRRLSRPSNGPCP
jgi:hypothetical protein